MTDAHGVARDQLRAFIERIERLEEEKKSIADDIKDVYGEAKGTGFDTKILREVIKIRKQDRDERAEREAVLDSYLAALGMIEQPGFFDGEPVQAVPAARQPAMPLRSDGGLSILTKHEDITTAPETAEETSVGTATAGPHSLAAHEPEESAVSHSPATATMSLANGPCDAGSERTAEEAAGNASVSSTNTELLGGFPVAAAEFNAEETGVLASTRQGVSVKRGMDHGVTGGESAATIPEMDRATEGSFETGSEAAEKGREAIPAGPEGADLSHAGASGSLAADERSVEATGGAALVRTYSDQPLTGGDHEVTGIAIGEREIPTSNTGEGAACALPAKPKFVLRPYCRDPGETCGGSGTTHCHSCLKAREEVAA
jgi:uncharacterized protein (UPF0335 family)